MSKIESVVLCWWKIAMMKRITITAMFLWVVISPVAAFGILQGDIDNSGKIDLQDAIAALQICAGMNVSIPVYIQADVNGNQKIDLAEAIYVLQCLARLRNNHSPVLTPIGNKTIDESSTLTFTISATDADGDTITYSVSTLPSGATFNAATKTFSWTPTYSQSGTYTVTFTASDDYGGSASETVTITVNNKIPVFSAIEYFPLNIGDWQDFKYSSTGVIHRSYTTGPRYIGGVAVKEKTYWDGQREYYTSDTNGVKLYGQYVIFPDFTGDVYFNSPLLLIPNNAQLGTTQISNSSYTVSVSGYVFHVNITSTATILGLEDVQTTNMNLKDCVKVSVRYDEYIVEMGESVPGDIVYYWFYKGVGCVKQVEGSDTYTITGSNINGVQQTY